MPTYEYECKSCTHRFEAFQTMSDSPLKDCPECGKEVRRLIFGGTGVIFKGSGFYVTDKSKGKTSGTQAGKKEQTDTRTGTSTGSDTGTGAGCKGNAASCPAAGETGSAKHSSDSSSNVKSDSRSA